MVPFGRNKDFVGRESLLAQLLERIPPGADEDDCQRTAIEGLGGVGKTQIALEAAFRVRDEHLRSLTHDAPGADALCAIFFFLTVALLHQDVLGCLALPRLQVRSANQSQLGELTHDSLDG